MQKPPIPGDEPERLETLEKYDILDTPPEKEFDDIVELASFICETPIALVSLVGENRQWFKARKGISACQTPREESFCAHAIIEKKLCHIPDAKQDERFHDNPAVTGGPGIRFYAGAPLVMPNGQAIGTLCVIDQVPRELSQSQSNALESLARQVVTQLELRLMLRVKDEFLQIASHDLKNPLTTILGGADLVKRACLPGTEMSEELHQVVHRMYSKAMLMKKLIEDFLDMQTLKDGQITLSYDKVNLVRLVEQCVSTNGTHALKKSIQLELDTKDNIQEIYADADRVTQILENLIDNAIKFSMPGKNVTVVLCEGSKDISVKVIDEGPGLTEEDLQKLFQQYSKLSNKPTGGEKSSGVGLFIAKQFARLHGGDLVARNNDSGVGVTFELSLPKDSKAPPVS